MFSSEGNYLSSFGNGKGQLNRPVGITIDRKQNRIIVTEYHNRVSVFNDNFEWLLSFGSYGDLNGEFNYPMGVAVSDGRILVTDCNNHRIQVFTSNGQFLFSFGSKGSEPGFFQEPDGIVVDELTRNIFVADYDNNRVQRFTRNGKFEQEIKFQHKPSGLVIDREQRLIIWEHRGCISIF